MKRSLLVFTTALLFLGLALAGCQKARFGHNEPPADELEREQKDTPKADDSANIHTMALNPDANLNCINDKLNTDLSTLGYQVVIVIDKAADAQTVQVYKNGVEQYNWLTSTGTEIPKENKLGRISSMKTPVGFFTPTQGRLYENYHSKSWDAEMPFAIFYYGGIAIHATHRENYELLGQRASGGCVRLEYENAKNLFQLVKHEAGMGSTVKISRDGCIERDEAGLPIMETGYRTLIVVVDSSESNLIHGEN